MGSLPTGEYKVSFGGNANHLAGGTVTGVAVTIPDATDCNVILTEAYGAVSGTVTGTDTGAPAIPGIEVTVHTSADVLMGTDSTDAGQLLRGQPAHR